MQIFSAGSSIKILSEQFEAYIKKTAEHVTGDVVLMALGDIKYARGEAEKLYELSKTYGLTLNEEKPK